VSSRFTTGVSIHSHTLHSEENLGFIPRYLSGVPIASRAIARQAERYKAITGRELDFSRGFWRPPLAPREAYDLEARQIRSLDLDPLVSLSDHDDIQAGSLLAVLDPEHPISVEWTIPFGPSFFHIGVHNLPQDQAPSILKEMHSFTADPKPAKLGGLLTWLDEFDTVLIVL